MERATVCGLCVARVKSTKSHSKFHIGAQHNRPAGQVWLQGQAQVAALNLAISPAGSSGLFVALNALNLDYDSAACGPQLVWESRLASSQLEGRLELRSGGCNLAAAISDLPTLISGRARRGAGCVRLECTQRERETGALEERDLGAH